MKQQGHASNNRNIGHIENVPVEGAPVQKHEIRNRAVQEPVEGIANRTPNQHAVTCSGQGLGGFAEPEHEHDGDGEAEGHEEPLHLGGEQAVGHTLVPGHGEVEEGGELDGFTFVKVDDAEDVEFRKLVDGEDEGGDEEAEAGHDLAPVERPPSPLRGTPPTSWGRTRCESFPNLLGKCPKGDGGLEDFTPLSQIASATPARLQHRAV